MPWQPLNKYCWDFWFIYKEPNLHVFYLQANRLACAYIAERRHNLSSIGHAILTDFGWQESSQDPALARREGRWDDVSIWTGSIIEKDGCYYMFYTARCSKDQFVLTAHERRQPQNIGVAQSDNLLVWQRTSASKENPIIPNPGLGSEFDGVSWRDPYVIKDATDGQFYAFICACPSDAPTDAGGAVAYAISLDLEDWQTQPYRILYVSPEFHYLEVPQVFWRKQPNCWRLYLLFSPYWNRFFERRDPKGTYYVRSLPIKDRRQITYDRIPWEQKSATLLSNGVYGGKFANPEAENPVFFGFQLEDEAGHFVGGICDPQWAIFNDDGTIGLCNSKPHSN